MSDQILTEEELNRDFDELLDGFAVDDYVYQTFNRFLNSHKALMAANAELSFKNAEQRKTIDHQHILLDKYESMLRECQYE